MTEHYVEGGSDHQPVTTFDDLPHNSVLIDVLLRAGVWRCGANSDTVQQADPSKNFFNVDGAGEHTKACVLHMMKCI